METQTSEFHKIKVASKSAEKFVSETVLSEVMYRGSVAMHFSCLLSTMEAASLPALTE